MEEPENFLACPFCDCDHNPAELGNQYEENFKFECVECKSRTGRYRTRAEAVEAWNRRAGTNGALNENRGERLGASGGLVEGEEWKVKTVRFQDVKVYRVRHGETVICTSPVWKAAQLVCDAHNAAMRRVFSLPPNAAR